MIRGAILGLALMLGASAASAQTFDSAWDDCSNTTLTATTADAVIAACSSAMRLRRLTQENQVYVYRRRAEAYFELRRYMEARDELREAYRLSGGMLDVMWRLGDVEYFLDNIDDAFAYWNKAYATGSEIHSNVFVDAVADRGNESLRARRYDAAIEDLKFAVEHDKSDVVLDVVWLARAYGRSGKQEEAERILAPWVEGHAMARLERAIARMPQRNVDGALADLNIYLAEYPFDGRAMYLHGVALQTIAAWGVRNPERRQPQSVWQQAEDEIVRGRQLDPDGVKELVREDVIWAAEFRPHEPKPDTGFPWSTPAKESATTAAPTAPSERGRFGPLVPIGAAAIIGLIVLAWNVIRRPAARKSPH